jgi:tRNA(Ile)-lysidine synthase
VLCLSGGADSSALALACAPLADAFPGGLSAAHVNHRLRGIESDGDADSVRELCGRLGLALAVLDGPVEPGPNLEARARAVRYGLLRASFPDAILCTAHHRDDQAETVVLRLLRGAGVRGLGGIARWRDDGVWRPLLDHPRDLLERTCREAGWSPRLDGSNADRRIARNFLRHELLPDWERNEPGVGEALARLARSAQELAPHLEGVLDRLAHHLNLQEDRGGFSLDLARREVDDDPHLDLLLERTWTRAGRRPWAREHRQRLLRDAVARRGKRPGGQGEIAVFGGGRLRVEVAGTAAGPD